MIFSGFLSKVSFLFFFFRSPLLFSDPILIFSLFYFPPSIIEIHFNPLFVSPYRFHFPPFHPIYFDIPAPPETRPPTNPFSLLVSPGKKREFITARGSAFRGRKKEQRHPATSIGFYYTFLFLGALLAVHIRSMQRN